MNISHTCLGGGPNESGRRERLSVMEVRETVGSREGRGRRKGN